SSQSGEVTWTWLRDYVYRGPKLLAQETSQPSPEDRVHLHLDHLGSPRGLTEANGRGLASFHYYGFGERILSAGADRPMALKSPLQYTGHERDFHAAWGDDLDNMHARHYSPWLGRFLSVDPRRVALLQFGDSNEEEQFERLLMQPRVWNQFSYGHDSPLVFTDPDGQAATMALAAPMAIGGEYAVVGSVGLTGPGALIFGSAAGGYLIGSGINELPGVSEFVSTGLGLALDHTVFMAANNRQRQRRVDGLIRNAEVHFGKIGGAGGPDRDPDLDHHKKEIRTALEDAKRVAQRLPGKARRLAEDRIDALIRKLDAL
ncbi:MAG: RHS repeat-associated core domain-containing protein, partial [Acidobacteriota bacterium]